MSELEMIQFFQVGKGVRMQILPYYIQTDTPRSTLHYCRYLTYYCTARTYNAALTLLLLLSLGT